MNPTTVATTTRPEGEVQVNSTRRVALVVGVLFILTFVTSIGGAFAYGPVLTDPNYVTGAGADTRVFLGAFLELLPHHHQHRLRRRVVPAAQAAERDHRPRLRGRSSR